MGSMRNILFYKYVEIADPLTLKSELRSLLERLDMRGTILLATEGVNGCVTGSDDAIAEFKRVFTSDACFADIEFKEGVVSEHGFWKIKVKVKPEIVTSKTTVNLQNRAPYIEPLALKELLESGEEVILLDARNNYESAIGRFANAITPNIRVFRDFTAVADSLAHLKDKRVVTYCTGGIRCEKASAVLKERGFTNVQQLHGGIIKYGENAGNAHWEGSCFVFDTRQAIPIALEGRSVISHCVHCNALCSEYHNCAVLSCDERFIACASCYVAHKECCSSACKVSQERKREVASMRETA